MKNFLKKGEVVESCSSLTRTQDPTLIRTTLQNPYDQRSKPRRNGLRLVRVAYLSARQLKHIG